MQVHGAMKMRMTKGHPSQQMASNEEARVTGFPMTSLPVTRGIVTSGACSHQCKLQLLTATAAGKVADCFSVSRGYHTASIPDGVAAIRDSKN